MRIVHTTEPSLVCIKNMFHPLEQYAGELPVEKIKKALSSKQGGFFVSPRWRINAIHVIEANSKYPTDCGFNQFMYSDKPVRMRGTCGIALFYGGHPETIECKKNFLHMGECVDQVPLREAFDIALVGDPFESEYLEVGNPPQVGDKIYIVGTPHLNWLPHEFLQQFYQKYPVVSEGKVMAIVGNSIIVDAPAFGGNSGGPLLNQQGQVIGVISTSVGHVKVRSVIPFKQHYISAVRFNTKMRELIKKSVNIDPLQ